jgi:hypothetical protein
VLRPHLQRLGLAPRFFDLLVRQQLLEIQAKAVALLLQLRVFAVPGCGTAV